MNNNGLILKQSLQLVHNGVSIHESSKTSSTGGVGATVVAGAGLAAAVTPAFLAEATESLLD
ncbi:hypothetical protein TI04_13635, partial [Achromatium sp. WMS2]